MQPMITAEPPKYEYKPNDFMYLSLVTAILCGIFSPLTLAISIPAVFFSHQVSMLHICGSVHNDRDHNIIQASMLSPVEYLLLMKVTSLY